MKKLLALFMLIGLLFVSCKGNDTVIENWKVAGTLPTPAGFTESIGVSGAFAGFIGDKLIVAGGANFPYAPVLEGGAKEFYNDIFVFDVNEDDTITSVGTGMLPKKLASGITLKKDENTLYFVGGENATGDSSAIYEITLTDNNVNVKEVATLPFTFAFGAVAIKDNMIYLAGGRQNKASSSNTWSYNIDTKETTALSPIPSEARVQTPFVFVNDKLYVFNGLGAVTTTLTDNYVYDTSSDTWTALENTTLNDKPFTTAGGGAALLSENEVLILGGVNKEVFDDAVSNLNTLKGEELEAFRQDYFNRTPEQFGFSKEQMVYNIESNTWYSLGVNDFNGGAGPFPVITKDGKVWHVSGEVKAAVRVPEVRVGSIKN